MTTLTSDPAPTDTATVAALDVLAEGKIGHVEARAEDDGVDRALLAVSGHDRAGSHLLDALGDDIDVALRERAQILAGEEDALAAEPVVRAQGLAQPRVGDLALEVAPREPLLSLWSKRARLFAFAPAAKRKPPRWHAMLDANRLHAAN